MRENEELFRRNRSIALEDYALEEKLRSLSLSLWGCVRAATELYTIYMRDLAQLSHYIEYEKVRRKISSCIVISVGVIGALFVSRGQIYNREKEREWQIYRDFLYNHRVFAYDSNCAQDTECASGSLRESRGWIFLIRSWERKISLALPSVDEVSLAKSCNILGFFFYYESDY